MQALPGPWSRTMQALPGPWGRPMQALPILAIAVAVLLSPPTAATPTACSCLCLPFSKGPALQPAPQAAVPGTGPASGLGAALTVSAPWSLQDCLLSCTSGHVTCCSVRPLAATTSPRKGTGTDRQTTVVSYHKTPQTAGSQGCTPSQAELPEAPGQTQACTLSLIPGRVIFSPVVGNDYAIFIL